VAAALVAAAATWGITRGEDTVLAVAPGHGCDDARPAADVDTDHPWCTLARAVRAAPAGATVEVHGGDYDTLRLADVRRPGPVTLSGDEDDRPVLAGLQLRAVTDLRLEGFRIAGPSRIDSSTRISITGNDVNPDGFVLGGNHDLRFEDNDVHDLQIQRPAPDETGPRCHSHGPTAGVAPRCGHGLRINYGDGYVIRGNRFRTIPADGIQLLGAADVLIEDNRFDAIAPTIDPEEHSDGIQFLGGTRSVAIRRNVFTRARGIIAIPDDVRSLGTTTGLVIEHNVFAGPGHFAVKLYDTTGLRLIGNTAWGTSGGIQLYEHPAEPYRMTGVVMVNNLVDHLDAEPSMFAERHHNLIADGARSGDEEIGGTPVFGDGYALAPGSPGAGAGTPDGTDLGAVQGD
jgi:hypothetical protein